MSLVPAQTINFDGVGLAPNQAYTVDAAGVGHFHKWKAGSTAEFDLTFTGVDVTVLSFAMDVRAALLDSTAKLSTGAAAPETITVTANPGGSAPNTVRFSISAAGTATLQTSGAVPPQLIYDIEVSQSGRTDRWVTGSILVTPEVTR